MRFPVLSCSLQLNPAWAIKPLSGGGWALSFWEALPTSSRDPGRSGGWRRGRWPCSMGESLVPWPGARERTVESQSRSRCRGMGTVRSHNSNSLVVSERNSATSVLRDRGNILESIEVATDLKSFSPCVLCQASPSPHGSPGLAGKPQLHTLFLRLQLETSQESTPLA